MIPLKNYQFHTSLFGELDVPVDKGLFKNFTITLAGKEIETSLDIFDGILNDDNQAIVQKFLEHIPEMYQKAKSTLFANCHTDSVIAYFIQYVTEVIDEDEDYQKYLLETLSMVAVEEITNEALIDVLEPRCIRISANQLHQLDCVFDFSLDENYSDELLVVYFDENFEVYSISHES
ncbi:DUF2004 domain-containing protein [Lysinibacillus sp. G4S2]|uniref:DUF2004 domain-containing protein n=1 Tax=Lysinibacillus sp. G4S2 TaxID=3055859 RepID=UPI0025A19F98|nr:DUF2004 domain-containing protein [Lysinibacillus sp. G4S2]MDM5248414.1 DUF2004 domain-containing protein [Lysinibacillus sp. G4S2]